MNMKLIGKVPCVFLTEPPSGLREIIKIPGLVSPPLLKRMDRKGQDIYTRVI